MYLHLFHQTHNLKEYYMHHFQGSHPCKHRGCDSLTLMKPYRHCVLSFNLKHHTQITCHLRGYQILQFQTWFLNPFIASPTLLTTSTSTPENSLFVVYYFRVLLQMKSFTIICITPTMQKVKRNRLAVSTVDQISISRDVHLAMNLADCSKATYMV